MPRLIPMLLLTALVGCNKSDAPPPVKIYEHERQQLDKAKQVEQQILQADQAQREALKKSEEGRD